MNQEFDVSVFQLNSSFYIFIALSIKNRTMRHRSSLLSNHRQTLPRNFQHEQSELVGQIRLSIYGKLQDSERSFQEEWHSKSSRC